MRVALTTLGCRLNEAELESWSHDFQSLGHQVRTRAEEADVLVVNTCAVTREAVKKSRQQIRKFHRLNPAAKLVVSGCYASLNPGLENKIDGIDLIVPNTDKDRLAEIVDAEISVDSMPSMATEPAEPALFARGRNRAFVKVQDGCRYRCTFCIVTTARGEERSKSIKSVVEEINRLTEQNVQEVVLTGVHIGGYGSDSGTTLYELVDTVLANTDIARLRLGSVEPWDLGDDFPALFTNPRFMPHLHLPLQSGSDSVLRRMARRCKTADYLDLLNQFREAVPNFNVSTDIIVGFPGESDSEWNQSRDFIEACRFSHIHIFPYSPREGTKAAGLPDQVATDVKKSRSRELSNLAGQMKQEIMGAYLGASLPVLIENELGCETNEYKSYFGYTPNYLKVKLHTKRLSSISNEIHTVNIGNYDARGGYLQAVDDSL